MAQTIEQLIEEVEKELPEELHDILKEREGAAIFAQKLPEVFPPASVSDEELPTAKKWNRIAGFYLQQKRFHEALVIYAALYDQMLAFQEETGSRCHKGLPLIRMSDCYSLLNYGLISARYLMLTLVEDAIREKGRITSERSGTYFRSVWIGRLSDAEFSRYSGRVVQVHQSDERAAFYPEWVLQQLDTEWISQAPSFQEAGVFVANRRYINHLIGLLGDRAGKNLEELADYLVSCMPGCRTARRQRSSSTEYDLVCSMDGLELDFRSEFGRYFVCECKDRAKAADFTTMAKFCRVLDSVKARFGILFSSQGITGEGERSYAELEQLKVFQDRGIVIVVVDRKDLERLAKGANFISILRSKYERVRLNLAPVVGARPARRVRRRE